MEQAQHLRAADLGPAARAALDAVRSGEIVVIDGDGRDEAALVDHVDLRFLRAAARYFGDPPDIDPEDESWLSDENLAALSDPQERYDTVMAHYWAHGLSLSRAGELLGQCFVEIRDHLNRLNLPMYFGPATVEELSEEVEAAERWMAGSRE